MNADEHDTFVEENPKNTILKKLWPGYEQPLFYRERDELVHNFTEFVTIELLNESYIELEIFHADEALGRKKRMVSREFRYFSQSFCLRVSMSYTY